MYALQLFKSFEIEHNCAAIPFLDILIVNEVHVIPLSSVSAFFAVICFDRDIIPTCL